MIPAPFFIVGCPRSGTTLLQILLDAHPHIAIPPESFVVQRFAPLLPLYGNLADPVRQLRFLSDLLADERIRDWELTGVTPNDILRRAERPTASALIAALFSLYAERHGKRRWGDKTPHHALCLPDLLALFPEARIIHLVRDGRDVAESTCRIPIGPSSLLGAARRWKHFVRTVRAAIPHIPPRQFLEVRFETMVQNPDAVRRDLLHFLGESEAVASPLGDRLPETETRARSASIAHHASLKTAITTAKIGVFRQSFSPRQIELFEAIAGDCLSELGYAREFPNPRPPTRREIAAAFLQDHTARYVRKWFQPHPVAQISKEIRLALQPHLRKWRLRWSAVT